VPARAIILIAFFSASLPVCFVRPFYGILLWVVVAFLNPQSYTWAAESFPWAMAVAIPTLAGFFLFSRGWAKRVASGKVALIVVLWGWFTVTTMVSTNTPLFFHHAEDTWYRWQFVSKVLLMTIVMVGIVDSFDRLKVLLIVIAASFGFYVTKALPFIILTNGTNRVFGPPNSMIADNNDFGLALNMTLPLFYGLYQTLTHPWLKRLCGFLTLITIPAIFFTYSRGALVGLAVVGTLMLMGMKRRVVLVPGIAFAAIIVFLFAPPAWQARMNPSQALDSSGRERLNAWAFSRNLFAEYPITGGGFATFTPELFSRYAPNAADIRGPYSIYFGVLAEHGAIGLALYLTLVVAAMRSTFRLAKWARSRDDFPVLNYAVAFRFSLIGFLVSGIFLGRAYFDYYFTFVGAIAILERLVREKSRAEDMGHEPEAYREPEFDEVTWQARGASALET
jgi:probable O-glycosylation ligase (exosortase A-associated)